jgi:hypothetical protein
MKNQKSGNASPKRKKRVPRSSMNNLKSYLDSEVTLIHENLDELKHFLSQHASLTDGQELPADTKKVDDYYHSAEDLFRQMALETDGNLPLEAKWYETFVLRKNKANPDQPSNNHSV